MELPVKQFQTRAEQAFVDLFSAAEQGLRVAGSGTDAATAASVVITMFQTGRQVLDAYQGVDGAPGLLAVAQPGAVFIDCSTIAVDEARAAHELAEAAGHRSLDAPVSGGVVGAENATLAFMVGGLCVGVVLMAVAAASRTVTEFIYFNF